MVGKKPQTISWGQTSNGKPTLSGSRYTNILYTGKLTWVYLVGYLCTKRYTGYECDWEMCNKFHFNKWMDWPENYRHLRCINSSLNSLEKPWPQLKEASASKGFLYSTQVTMNICCSLANPIPASPYSHCSQSVMLTLLRAFSGCMYLSPFKGGFAYVPL